jgi:hypothetical protein
LTPIKINSHKKPSPTSGLGALTKIITLLTKIGFTISRAEDINYKDTQIITLDLNDLIKALAKAYLSPYFLLAQFPLSLS